MQFLLILNDPPYGTERVYNGLRLGLALAKANDAQVTIFLMGDAVGRGAAWAEDARGLLQHRAHGEAARRGAASGVALRDMHGRPRDER